jgi:hypothetical protein
LAVAPWPCVWASAQWLARTPQHCI